MCVTIWVHQLKEYTILVIQGKKRSWFDFTGTQPWNYIICFVSVTLQSLCFHRIYRQKLKHQKSEPVLAHGNNYLHKCKTYASNKRKDFGNMHENIVPGSMRTSCAPKRRNKNDFVFSLKYSQQNKFLQCFITNIRLDQNYKLY